MEPPLESIVLSIEPSLLAESPVLPPSAPASLSGSLVELELPHAGTSSAMPTASPTEMETRWLRRTDTFMSCQCARQCPSPALSSTRKAANGVSKAWDYTDECVKTTKTWETRDVPIEPTLVPLLKAMHKRAGGKGPLLPMLASLADESALSKLFRSHLEAAGITRPDLFPSEDPIANTRQIATRFRSLRDWGITWRLWRGDNPSIVQRNAGHKRFSTTEKYIADVEKLSPECGVPFPLLPSKFASKELGPELQPTGTSDDSSCERRELNPHESYLART